MKKKKKRKTRNKFETRLSQWLRRKKANAEYETEKIPYIIEGYYLPDFIVKVGEHKIYIEAKGHFRPEQKRKMVAVKRLHPDLDIRIVFYSYKLEYVKWAKKHGFPYSIGDIPKEWIEETHV